MKKHKNQAAEELKEMLPMVVIADVVIALSITVIGFFSGFDFR